MNIRKITRDGKIFYEIAKEDFEKLKDIIAEEREIIRKEERNKGREDVANYIFFCGKYYPLELNMAGICSLCKEIIDLMCGKTDRIENTYGYSFEDYVEKYM